MSERRLFTVYIDFLTPWSVSKEDTDTVIEYVKSVINRFFPVHERLFVNEIGENTVMTSYLMNFQSICTPDSAEKFANFFNPPQNILQCRNARISILHSTYTT